MSKQNKVNLRLTIDVSYIPNGESVGRLMERLEYLAKNASGAGMFTGEGPAAVDTWALSIKPIQKLTVLEWLKQLSPDVRKKARANMRNQHAYKTNGALIVESLSAAVRVAFSWGGSNEGYELWELIHDKAKQDEQHSYE